MNDINPNENAAAAAPAAGKARKKKHKNKFLLKIVGVIAVVSPIIAFSGEMLKFIKEAFHFVEPIIKTECNLEVDPLVFPSSVEYSGWDDMILRLKGKYNCSDSFGLYVTFIPRDSSDSRWRVEPPGGNTDLCKGVSGSLLHPQCWEPKKPIVLKADGEWEWEFTPPLLRKIAEFGDNEKIKLLYEVRDYDSPDKTLQTDSLTIYVKKDS